MRAYIINNLNITEQNLPPSTCRIKKGHRNGIKPAQFCKKTGDLAKLDKHI